jgi:tetratricopeptide (TPR) repeat protein
MSVMNGFMIILMLLLLIYTFYRLAKRKSMLMLIPACGQVFCLIVAIQCFIHNVEALQMIQACYILFGILPPAVFLVLDYSGMVGRFKRNGSFQGLVEPAASEALPGITVLPAEGIHTVTDDKPIEELMKELRSLPEEMQRNIRRLLSNSGTDWKGERDESLFHAYDILSKTVGTSYTLCFNAACCCYRLGRYEEALKGYGKALELAGKRNEELSDIYYNMGNALYMLKRYDASAECFEKALELKQGQVNVTENLAFLYVRMGEKEKGIELLRKTSSGKDHYRAHLISGKLLNEAGKYAEAEEELKKCISIDPNTVEARDELGKVKMRQNMPEAAAVLYSEILRINARDYGTWCSRAAVLGKMERWGEAVDCYREAVRLNPKNARTYYNMAAAMEENQDRASAIEAYRSAIRLNPDFTEAYNNLGIALSLTGQHEQALEIYEEGIGRYPQDFSLFFNMGITLYEMGRYTEAVAACRSALDIRPDEQEVYYYLGAALTELHHFNDAIDAYKSAMKLKPDEGELHYHIAAVYAMLGRYDIAGENLKLAINLKQSLRDDARNNRAFEGMRGRSDFRQMVS